MVDTPGLHQLEAHLLYLLYVTSTAPTERIHLLRTIPNVKTKTMSLSGDQKARSTIVTSESGTLTHASHRRRPDIKRLISGNS